MVDNFALLVPHILLVIAVLRLVRRDDLDRDPPCSGETSAAETPRG